MYIEWERPCFSFFFFFISSLVGKDLCSLSETDYFFLNGVAFLFIRSSSREMRNRAEKQRRDKLNAYISELYSLVPSAAAAPRKLDKTSTLRLSANFLRIHQSKIWFDSLALLAPDSSWTNSSSLQCRSQANIVISLLGLECAHLVAKKCVSFFLSFGFSLNVTKLASEKGPPPLLHCARRNSRLLCQMIKEPRVVKTCVLSNFRLVHRMFAFWIINCQDYFVAFSLTFAFFRRHRCGFTGQTIQPMERSCWSYNLGGESNFLGSKTGFECNLRFPCYRNEVEPTVIPNDGFVFPV